MIHGCHFDSSFFVLAVGGTTAVTFQNRKLGTEYNECTWWGRNECQFELDG
jgi:hypothetical protein